MTHRRLTAAELPEWLAAHPDALLLDARDSARHAQGHLPGAMRLDGHNHDALLREEPRSRPVLVYCYSGNSSQAWARLFAQAGFSEVADLAGGWVTWQLTAADRR
ncbi:rhodanese-like domain-containing protein [Sphaerotilus microaerophilus]|jgi:rhodanese-related sulfurtransferase|uniref:Rhodanese domain-containing protein n=1 Tax=Sphaerotilus microaerophilus TaxID=2914710 RepID=A0ABN6PIB2_9BURK|nr:rhodanese-like domain-containing protein [Sphaerotilus sp. FB-5]BDI03355.1 hypothetical protein CATMQ487_03250 [Sphaerotilus sp. FB-5]